jgi:toxin ParE1/3/4
MGCSQAQKYFYGMLHDTFEVLVENVNLGRDASEFIADLKRFSYKAPTLFYLRTASGILIIRVLSHRMDYEHHLK